MQAGFAAFSPPGDAIFGALSDMLDPELAGPYFSGRTLFSREHIAQLTCSRFERGWAGQSWVRREHELERAASNLKGVDQASFLELQTYMLSTLLRDSDQMSMAHGLELRVPLIDPILVEHVLPIAKQAKIAGRIGKQLLFEALGDLLPPEVETRRKRGFTLPFRQWLEQDLRHTVESVFMDSRPRGPWELEIFRQVWLDFKRGRVAWSRVLALYVLENWLQRHRVNC